jgi:hypothetical protein
VDGNQDSVEEMGKRNRIEKGRYFRQEKCELRGKKESKREIYCHSLPIAGIKIVNRRMSVLSSFTFSRESWRDSWESCDGFEAVFDSDF